MTKSLLAARISKSPPNNLFRAYGFVLENIDSGKNVRLADR